MHRPALIAGSIFAALAVITGAFGAHALKAILPEAQLLVFETGVRYQFYHSFALLITGVAFLSFPYKNLKIATNLFIIGILFFSGSLYILPFLVVAGISPGIAGIVTPVGGLLLIAGWVSFLSGIIRNK